MIPSGRVGKSLVVDRHPGLKRMWFPQARVEKTLKNFLKTIAIPCGRFEKCLVGIGFTGLTCWGFRRNQECKSLMGMVPLFVDVVRIG